MKVSAIHIIKKLQKAGYIAYLAGGCVRDELLGLKSKDYDIVTDAKPEEVKLLFPKAHSVGVHFGVMLVKEGGHYFEIATFRVDGNYDDKHPPETVCFVTPKEDAFRRDFTINGLFQDPITGEIHDYVEGQKDLAQKRVRAIGSAAERFEEDGVRLLRAIRFAITLGFNIESNTWEAIKKYAHLLKNISVERINQEFSKIIVHKNRAQGLHLLVESGLMEYIIPEVLDLRGCDQPPQFHPEGDVYIHTHMMLGLLKQDPSLELCLAVLLHDIGKPATKTYDAGSNRIRFNGHDRVGADMARIILNRLKYPKDVIRDVVAMVANHMRFISVSDMKKATLRRFLARPTFQDDMELHRVDCLGSNGNLENYEFMRAKEEAFKNEPIIPAPLITGKDLIEMGFEPGAIFSQILRDVQEKQLEGELLSKKEALEYISEYFIDLKKE